MGNWRFGAFPKLPYSTMQQLNLDWILDRIRRFLPDTGTKGQVLTRTKDGAAWVDPEAASGAVSSVNGKTGAVVLTASDVGALPESYVPPAAPVQSVNGQTGAVQLSIPDSTSDLTNDSGFITAAQAAAAAPVQSVNGMTGNVVLDAAESGAGYCKMPDGTLICWGVLSNILPLNLTGTPYGSVYYHEYAVNVTFPIAFIDTPSISVSPRVGKEASISWIVANATSFSSFDTLSGKQMIESTSKLSFSWQAIGRWKE